MTNTTFSHLNQSTARSQLLTQRARSQQGQSAVEIALLLPLLLLLLFGIVLSGFMFYAYIQVSNAAREGARAGSVYWETHPVNGLPLETTVRKAIYDDKGTVTPSDDVSALGFLPTTSSSFNVNTDVTISLLKPNGTGGDLADPRPGDRLTVDLIYRYRMPLVAVALIEAQVSWPSATPFQRRNGTLAVVNQTTTVSSTTSFSPPPLSRPRAEPGRGKVLRLFREDGYGFLETRDGREVYFNERSVLRGGFKRLRVGTPVRFAEEAGEKGPQASTVAVARTARRSA